MQCLHSRAKRWTNCTMFNTSGASQENKEQSTADKEKQQQPGRKGRTRWQTIFSTPGSHYCPVQFLKTFIGGSVDLKLTKLEDVAISVALYTMLIKLFFLCSVIPEIGTSYKCTCMSLYALAATANQLLVSVFPAVQGRTRITLISQRGCVSTSNVINRKWSITASAASYHFPNCPSQVPCAHIFLGTAFL